jgi:hypothetical protein
MAKIPGACNHTGKCAQSELLPSRHALGTLTKGDPMRRTINDYAKASPVGEGGFGGSSIMSLLQPSGKLNRVA